MRRTFKRWRRCRELKWQQLRSKTKALSGDLSGAGGNLGRGGAAFDFSRARKFTDWRSMILESDVDAVDLCLPTEFHCEATLAALARGKHVLVEKPMALTAVECAEMLAAAEGAGKTRHGGARVALLARVSQAAALS